MRIESDLKLDYSDVLLRPKRSTLGSRKDVSLERIYKFRNSEQTYHGVPIMAANMDQVKRVELLSILVLIMLKQKKGWFLSLILLAMKHLQQCVQEAPA